MDSGGPACTGPDGTPNPGVTVASGGTMSNGGGPADADVDGATDVDAVDGGAIRGAGTRPPLPDEA